MTNEFDLPEIIELNEFGEDPATEQFVTSDYWTAWRHLSKDKHIPTTMEGFYFWFMATCTEIQRDFFAIPLKRLAKRFPEKDPRDVILNFFAEYITSYENATRRLKVGKGLSYEKSKRIVNNATSRELDTYITEFRPRLYTKKLKKQRQERRDS